MDYKKIQHYFWGLLTALLLMPFSVQAIAPDMTDVASIEDQDKLLFAQALELSVAKQWLAAEPIYRDLVKRNKEWPEPKNNLAILLLKTNRLEEAKSMLEEAVSSSPSYRIAQKNRTQLYDFLDVQAYGKALGKQHVSRLPEMDFIEQIYQPVKTLEKIVEKKVEVIVEKKVFVKSTPIQNTSNTEVVSDIREQLLNWSHAWSQGDYDYYVQSYADNFVPADERKSFSEWKKTRKAKLKRGVSIQVTVDHLRVFLEGSSNYALVEFIQYYTSPIYSDSVIKQLYMQKDQNNWKILSERVIKTL